MSERATRNPVVALRGEGRIDGPRTGKIVAFRHGRVRVTFEGCSQPQEARVSATLQNATLAAATRDGADVLLLFEDGDPGRPVVLAILRSDTPLVDDLLTAAPQPRSDVAALEGPRVVVQGQEEVVVRCGKASLTLRRDGQVMLRGVTVVSQAEQVQKIRGGKVQIN